MLIAETKTFEHKEIPPARNVYQVVWTFNVAADSQEEASAKIKKTMDKFAEMMGWPVPDDMTRLRKGQ